jgi:hypothetical protein
LILLEYLFLLLAARKYQCFQLLKHTWFYRFVMDSTRRKVPSNF